jgi:hypothetical protein
MVLSLLRALRASIPGRRSTAVRRVLQHRRRRRSTRMDADAFALSYGTGGPSMTSEGRAPHLGSSASIRGAPRSAATSTEDQTWIYDLDGMAVIA